MVKLKITQTESGYREWDNFQELLVYAYGQKFINVCILFYFHEFGVSRDFLFKKLKCIIVIFGVTLHDMNGRAS